MCLRPRSFRNQPLPRLWGWFHPYRGNYGQILQRVHEARRPTRRLRCKRFDGRLGKHIASLLVVHEAWQETYVLHMWWWWWVRTYDTIPEVFGENIHLPAIFLKVHRPSRVLIHSHCPTAQHLWNSKRGSMSCLPVSTGDKLGIIWL